jgi:hypothetical protein
MAEFFIWVRLNISTLRAAIRALREQATLRRYTSRMEEGKERSADELSQSKKSDTQADEIGEELKQGRGTRPDENGTKSP